MAGGMLASISQAPLGGSGKFSNESTEDRSGVSIHVARLSPFARARITNAVAVTRVDVLHLHHHHRQTRVRTSLQPPRSTTESGRGLWARPPVLSPVLLQANHNPPQPSKNTGQKLLNNNTAFKSLKARSLTLPLQNHLDHFNTLLQDLWYQNIHDLLNVCTSTRAVA